MKNCAKRDAKGHRRGSKTKKNTSHQQETHKSSIMLGKYVKFMLSRAIGTGVDTLVLWLLSRFLFDGGYWATYIISPIISFEAAVMCNFLCSYYWIWRSRISSRDSRSFWRHFVGFNLSSFAGFLVKMVFLLLFEKIFGWGVVVCNLVALCISGVLNFFLSEAVVFRKKSERVEHELLSIEELGQISPLFRGSIGRLFARFAMWVCGVGRLNRLYNAIYPYKGAQGARAALEYIGCDYYVGNAERLDSLPKGAFITISNHPYGAIDGVILLDMIASRRGDMKVMVNRILGRVEPLSDNFFTVSPTLKEKRSADGETLRAIRSALKHLHNGHPLGLFPSGAVSDLHIRRGDISDRPWQESIVRLIEKAQVPVVPIHFEGRNSMFYYLLGVVDWRIRLLRLPREVLNKSRGKHRVNIGKIITPEELRAAGSVESIRDMLREVVYGMPSAQEYARVTTSKR